MNYTLITTSQELDSLVAKWKEEGISSIAMDFEEESNLHCYGEYICTMQLFDGSSYYLVDCLKLAKTQDGLNALKNFLEGNIEKVMFACQSDAALARKTLGIQLAKIYDIRILAMALGINGNLSALESLYFKTNPPEQDYLLGNKKKFQTANWMRRPIPESQILYALGDVQHLLELKTILEDEIKRVLPNSRQKAIAYEMKNCAKQKNPDRPGWEKICNYKMMTHKEQVYVKHYFLARDTLARKHNVPASNILPKQTIVAMAKRGTWKGFFPTTNKELVDAFTKAQETATCELL